MFEVGSVCRLTFFDDENQSHELHYDGHTKRAQLDGWEEQGFLAEMSVPNLDMVELEEPHQSGDQSGHANLPLVVPFSSQLCDDASLTGGKGASLGDFISTALPQVLSLNDNSRKIVQDGEREGPAGILFDKNIF